MKANSILTATLAIATGLLLCAPAFAQTMTAQEAHARASKGELVLVDLRRVEEWKQTGVGTSATPISMHEPGFLDKLATAVKGDKARPIALICAAGGRSTRMRIQLLEAGYSNVADVNEGMLGNPRGPGWIKSGLPVKPYTE